MKARHKAALVVTVVLTVWVVHDLAAPRGRGLAAQGAISLIDKYRAHVSPRLAGTVTCRFVPTCSAYGRASIEKHGFAKGASKAAWRIARCGPWTSAGTVDLP